MTFAKLASFSDDLPAHDDPIIAHEETGYGWRGLSAKGEILEVRSRDGVKPAVPDGSMIVMRGGAAVARRAIGNAAAVSIPDYLQRLDRAAWSTQHNDHAAALVEIEAAIAIAPTLLAKLNRAMLLLALGRWREGFAEYRRLEDEPSLMRPAVKQAFAAGLKRWDGEDLAGKRLLLLHAHGFGDTIMALRYVPALRAAGVDVVLKMPPELERLAGQLAPVTDELCDAVFCPILHLVGLLLPVRSEPYLRIDTGAVDRWRAWLGVGRRIGIAWAPSVISAADYPRAIPLDRLRSSSSLAGAALHSVQKQSEDEARAAGVAVHDFIDFADCAAAMLAMDRIVSIDTAALHLAGAIGHPRVDALLSYWTSWRWQAPWYPTVRLCRQAAPDDWTSALAQIEEASDADQSR